MSPIGTKTRPVDLSLFKRLFIQREDVLAEGGAWDGYQPFDVEPGSLDQLLLEHLDGHRSFGTYVLKPGDPTTRFAMIDVDTGDYADVVKVDEVLCGLGLDSEQILIEESGRKGWHLWLFFHEPYPQARAVRQWLKAAGAGHELNPKQDSVAEGGYGNLVKLPLGKHPVTGKRSHLVSHTHLEEVRLVDPIGLVPPATATQRPAGQTGTVSTGFPCTDAILRGEVGPGFRHDALVHAGLHLRKHGVRWDEAAPILERINGEFAEPMGDGELAATILDKEPSRNIGPTCQSQFSGNTCSKENCRLLSRSGTLSRGAVGDLDDHLTKGAK